MISTSKTHQSNHDNINNNNTLDVDKIRQPLYSTHDSGVNLSYEWRVEQLKILRRLILDNRQLFLEALADDLGRYPTESVCAECIPIETEIDYMLSNLKEWMKPEMVSTPLLMAPAKAWIENKPLQPPGVLIIGPSNYPLQLCLKPLAGVLAGGNPCIIKPRYGTVAESTSIYCQVSFLFAHRNIPPSSSSSSSYPQ